MQSDERTSEESITTAVEKINEKIGNVLLDESDLLILASDEISRTLTDDEKC